MSYEPSNLSVLAYANGFTLWHYKSATSVAKTKLNNFWSGDAKKTLRDGDMILATCSDGFLIMKVTNDREFAPAKRSLSATS